METPEHPNQESVIRTISEHAHDNPHVILTAGNDQSAYTRQFEERLAQLEKIVEQLAVEKSEPSKDEERYEPVIERVLKIVE